MSSFKVFLEDKQEQSPNIDVEGLEYVDLRDELDTLYKELDSCKSDVRQAVIKQIDLLEVVLTLRFH